MRVAKRVAVLGPGHDPKLPKYMDMIVDATANIKRGHAYTIEVLHDDWCALLAGTGQCNCEPTLKQPKMVKKEQ